MMYSSMPTAVSSIRCQAVPALTDVSPDAPPALLQSSRVMLPSVGQRYQRLGRMHFCSHRLMPLECLRLRGAEVGGPEELGDVLLRGFGLRPVRRILLNSPRRRAPLAASHSFEPANILRLGCACPSV